MAFSLISETDVPGANSPLTTSAIDTTGANLLVASLTWYSSYGDPSISDSKGNTWTPLTKKVSFEVAVRLFYSAASSVGSGHTFTATGFGPDGIAGVLAVQAWSGANATPFDVENGATTTSTTIQAGSITPSQNGALIVVALGVGPGGTSYTVDSGATLTANYNYLGGTNEGGALGYLVQGSAAAINPTWTVTNSSLLAAVIAAFKDTGGGAAIAKSRTIPMTSGIIMGGFIG